MLCVVFSFFSANQIIPIPIKLHKSPFIKNLILKSSVIIPPTKFMIELENPAPKNPKGNNKKTSRNPISELKSPFLFFFQNLISPIITNPKPQKVLCIVNELIVSVVKD